MEASRQRGGLQREHRSHLSLLCHTLPLAPVAVRGASGAGKQIQGISVIIATDGRLPGNSGVGASPVLVPLECFGVKTRSVVRGSAQQRLGPPVEWGAGRRRRFDVLGRALRVVGRYASQFRPVRGFLGFLPLGGSWGEASSASPQYERPVPSPLGLRCVARGG
jgi:hypothetical protein